MRDGEEEEASEAKLRKMASDIVSELIKSGQPLRIDVKPGDIVAKCGPRFASCGDYECEKKFRCTFTKGFSCTTKFKDSTDYTLTLG